MKSKTRQLIKEWLNHFHTLPEKEQKEMMKATAKGTVKRKGGPAKAYGYEETIFRDLHDRTI